MKAFIVDDEPVTVTLLINMLKSAGIEANYCLPEEPDIVDRIIKYNPDVLILDLYLGELDGAELGLKIHSYFPDLPLIAISSSKQMKDKLKIFHSSFMDYLEKPIIKDDFIRKIKTYGLLGGLLKRTGTLCKVERDVKLCT